MRRAISQRVRTPPFDNNIYTLYNAISVTPLQFSDVGIVYCIFARGCTKTRRRPRRQVLNHLKIFITQLSTMEPPPCLLFAPPRYMVRFIKISSKPNVILSRYFTFHSWVFFTPWFLTCGENSSTTGPTESLTYLYSKFEPCTLKTVPIYKKTRNWHRVFVSLCMQVLHFTLTMASMAQRRVIVPGGGAAFL